MIDCGNCHTCGTMLQGDYCPDCKTTRRYKSHGYRDGKGFGLCPSGSSTEMTEREKWVRDFDARTAEQRGMAKYETAPE